jgi:hypothetical protein
MPKVIELYRYPVKSFTPERTDTLKILDGRVAGDRVLAFRFANKGNADDLAWQSKHNFLALVNTPALSLLELKFDHVERMLSLRFEDVYEIDGSVDSEKDRFDICQTVGEIVSSLDVNPLVKQPERLPLMLVGDGRRGLFHDTADGGLTVHSNESLSAVETHTRLAIDGQRFRTNIVINDVEAWEEFSWSGRLSIGTYEYKVVKPATRCLAIHANPVTGARDIQLLDALVRTNGIEVPTFGIRVEPVEYESKISLGDSVCVSK